MKLTNFINTSPRWALSRRKTENERLHQERYTEVASKFPRIAEIDDEIKHNSLQIAMLRVMADDSSATLSDIGAEDLDSQIKNLIDEKKRILTGAGYPEDYLDPIVTCPVCQDQGYIDHRMCDCLKQLMITDLYRNSNLDKILEKENFDTFSLDYYSTEPFGNLPSPHKHMEDVLDKSKAFVQNFNSENKNILIYGDTGLGKTFLRRRRIPTGPRTQPGGCSSCRARRTPSACPIPSRRNRRSRHGTSRSATRPSCASRCARGCRGLRRR